MLYAIRLTHPELSFSAEHAIRFDNGEVEKVHSHTFRTNLEIAGPVNSSGYVVDFLAAFRILKRLLSQLDGLTFLPKETENPTAENLGTTLLEKFRVEALKEKLFSFPPEDYRFRLELEESPGMWAVCSSST
ncbi:MAG: 6-carboxytetrahydropterin synthase [Planctomycetaceae bacterium]|jgi:6-pyruvoyl-tetrahydropterin synthase|nr:6-carboxytetrahydropterin synthase [Planctomycetaceae bacterium]